MLTKSQLSEVHKELDRLEETWKKDHARKETSPISVSHKLVGYLLMAFNAHRKCLGSTQVSKAQPKAKEPAQRDPKTGRFLRRKK